MFQIAYFIRILYIPYRPSITLYYHPFALDTGYLTLFSRPTFRPKNVGHLSHYPHSSDDFNVIYQGMTLIPILDMSKNSSFSRTVTSMWTHVVKWTRPNRSTNQVSDNRNLIPFINVDLVTAGEYCKKRENK